MSELEILRAENADLKLRLTVMLEALNRYGRHDGRCWKRVGTNGIGFACVCGLRELLSGSAK